MNRRNFIKSVTATISAIPFFSSSSLASEYVEITMKKLRNDYLKSDFQKDIGGFAKFCNRTMYNIRLQNKKVRLVVYPEDNFPFNNSIVMPLGMHYSIDEIIYRDNTGDKIIKSRYRKIT